MWLKILHSLGLTNLSDQQVKEYAGLRIRRDGYSLNNRDRAFVVLLVCFSIYVAAILLSRGAALETARQTNAQTADKILQNSNAVDKQITAIRANLEAVTSQLPPPVKSKVSDIARQLQDVVSANNKINGTAAIDKFANRKKFRAGAIVTAVGVTIYKPDQQQEFLRDAARFIDEHPLDYSFSSRGYDQGSASCDAPEGGCISLISKSNLLSELPERVEAVFTDQPLYAAEALDALGEKELAASFRAGQEPLCRWLHHLPAVLAMTNKPPR